MNSIITLVFLLIVIVIGLVMIPNLPSFFNYKLHSDIIYMSFIFLSAVGIIGIIYKKL